MDECDKVFVYGSLKKGWVNNRLLMSSTLLQSNAVTKDKYGLLNVGFPYMIPEHRFPEDMQEEYCKQVQGELYQMKNENTLRALDFLEGEGSHYDRRLILLEDNTECWTYLLLQGAPYEINKCNLTTEGYWLWA